MQLFLDCDGVLANFDRGAASVPGMPPKAFIPHRSARQSLAALKRRHPELF